MESNRAKQREARDATNRSTILSSLNPVRMRPTSLTGMSPAACDPSYASALLQSQDNARDKGRESGCGSGSHKSDALAVASTHCSVIEVAAGAKGPSRTPCAGRDIGETNMLRGELGETGIQRGTVEAAAALEGFGDLSLLEEARRVVEGAAREIWERSRGTEGERKKRVTFEEKDHS